MVFELLFKRNLLLLRNQMEIGSFLEIFVLRNFLPKTDHTLQLFVVHLYFEYLELGGNIVLGLFVVPDLDELYLSTNG